MFLRKMPRWKSKGPAQQGTSLQKEHVGKTRLQRVRERQTHTQGERERERERERKEVEGEAGEGRDSIPHKSDSISSLSPLVLFRRSLFLSRCET